MTRHEPAAIAPIPTPTAPTAFRLRRTFRADPVTGCHTGPTGCVAHAGAGPCPRQHTHPDAHTEPDSGRHSIGEYCPRSNFGAYSVGEHYSGHTSGPNAGIHSFRAHADTHSIFDAHSCGHKLSGAHCIDCAHTDTHSCCDDIGHTLSYAYAGTHSYTDSNSHGHPKAHSLLQLSHRRGLRHQGAAQ